MVWNKAIPHQHFPDWGSGDVEFFHNISPFSTICEKMGNINMLL